MTTVAVVVPTYRRPDDLARCLASLSAQTEPPDEVIVVTRTGDPGVAVARRAAVQVLELDEPGALAAMVAGARATSAEVVAFTDDDAVVPPDWLARIAAGFARSPLVGGVGGRDAVIHGDGRIEPVRQGAVVGAVTWYGRHHGHHHEGTGAPRDVAFLKGVNAAYRRGALALPRGLHGSGAQPHFEVAVGRYATTHGWRLVYDPSLVVEHRPAAREGEDQRDEPTPAAIADAAFNLVVAIGGIRGALRVAYASLWGDRGVPGLVRGAVALVRQDRATVRRVGPSLRGTLLGGLALATRRGVRYETFA